MDTSTVHEAVLDEAIWRAWVQKGKLSEQATARKMKWLTGIALVLIALGSAIYLLAVK